MTTQKRAGKRDVVQDDPGNWVRFHFILRSDKVIRIWIRRKSFARIRRMFLRESYVEEKMCVIVRRRKMSKIDTGCMLLVTGPSCVCVYSENMCIHSFAGY